MYPEGRAFTTIGELFQGPMIYLDEIEFAIISLLSDRLVQVRYVLDSNWCYYDSLKLKTKTLNAVNVYLNLYGKTLPPGYFIFSQNIPEGVGMASSTADIVATIRCLDSLFAIRTPQNAIQNILLQIERSDSVFLNKFSLYLSSKQKICDIFQYYPKFYIFYCIEDYKINTEDVSLYLKSQYFLYFNEYQKILNGIVDAFYTQNIKNICEFSTQGSILSQEILPKKYFKRVHDNYKYFNADGIFVAHTGSIIGYLFDIEPKIEIQKEICSFFREYVGNCYTNFINKVDCREQNLSTYY